MIKKLNKTLLFLFITIIFFSSSIKKSFADEEKKVFFVGDDSVVGMKSATPEKEEFINYIYIAENQKGLTWLKTQNEKLKDLAGKGDIIVFSIGFSEISNPYKVEDYAKTINDFRNSKEIKRKKVKVYVTNLLPINDEKYISLSNEKIIEWNNNLKRNLSKDIGYLDIYSEFEKKIKTLEDGYHYTTETYKNVLDYILNKIGKPTISEIEQSKNKKEIKKEVGKNSWGKDSFGYKVYYDEKSQIVRNSFKDINGATYYFDKDGHYFVGLKEINKQKYFFNELGMMKKNVVTRVNKDNLMAFDKEGKSLTHGWHTIEDADYYVNKKGFILTGWWKIGTNEHYFKEDGKVAKGLEVIGDKTYYFDNKGTSRIGWIDIDGNKYYFKDNGEMAVGITQIEDNYYNFDKNGKMIKGFVDFQNGKKYFDEKTGIMAIGEKEINNKYYYFDEDGFLLQGWKKNKKGEKSYYDKNGQKVIGLQKIGSKYFFFDEKGIMQKGHIKINGKYKYFSPDNGEILTGIVVDSNGKKYVLDEEGNAITGIKIIDGKISKINEKGEIVFAISIILIMLIILLPIAMVIFLKYKKGNLKMIKKLGDKTNAN